VFVLGGAAAGVILALGGAGGDGRGLSRASFPGFQLSFRYPSPWQRQDWCWIGSSVFPLTLLTTAHTVPPCEQNSLFGQRTPLPPPLRIGSDGVAAWWLAANRAGSARFAPNARLGGRPARITVRQESTRRTLHSYVNCRGTGPTQRSLDAVIQGPSSSIREIHVGAVICGPDFASGEADVRRMLASLRFTR
jgi:hypothetical protein